MIFRQMHYRCASMRMMHEVIYTPALICAATAAANQAESRFLITI
jgi:queuine/archaeosine tRNA-ribosyltransferase